MIDRVSEMSTGNNWELATQKNIMEFLSIYSYSIAKQQHQEQEMKKHYDKMKNR